MITPYPSSVLDEYNLTSLVEPIPVIFSEKQPMQFGEIMAGQRVNPLSDFVLENSKTPFNPQVAQPSNAPTLEDIYSMVQENNSRLGNIKNRLRNIESQLLFFQEQQTQLSQTLSTLITFLTSSFPPS